MTDKREPGGDFGHVEAWVFDLDNTLYPSDCNLFAEIDTRMGGCMMCAPTPSSTMCTTSI